jgi:SH3 domain protein
MRQAWPIIILISLAFPVSGKAETTWVSDQFEITMRSGPSTENAIILMLPSGTALEVLERDEESGYARVQTGSGRDGWVLSRYLMSQPPARQQVADLAEQLSRARSRGDSLSGQFEAVQQQQEDTAAQLRKLQEEKNALSGELEEVRRISADVLAINEDNRDLRQRLSDTEITLNMIEEENHALRSRQNRDWFVAGAAVLFVGMLMGLVIPRIRLRRRSRYDRF